MRGALREASEASRMAECAAACSDVSTANATRHERLIPVRIAQHA